MKRKNVIMMVLAATMMVSAVPAYAAIKAEAKPEGTAVAVKAEAKPERAAVAVKAEAKPERANAVAIQYSQGRSMPEFPEVPFV